MLIRNNLYEKDTAMGAPSQISLSGAIAALCSFGIAHAQDPGLAAAGLRYTLDLNPAQSASVTQQDSYTFVGQTTTLMAALRPTTPVLTAIQAPGSGNGTISLSYGVRVTSDSSGSLPLSFSGNFLSRASYVGVVRPGFPITQEQVLLQMTVSQDRTGFGTPNLLGTDYVRLTSQVNLGPSNATSSANAGFAAVQGYASFAESLSISSNIGSFAVGANTSNTQLIQRLDLNGDVSSPQTLSGVFSGTYQVPMSATPDATGLYYGYAYVSLVSLSLANNANGTGLAVVDPVLAIDTAYLAAHPAATLTVSSNLGNVAAVPEPRSAALFAFGLAVMATRGVRRGAGSALTRH